MNWRKVGFSVFPATIVGIWLAVIVWNPLVGTMAIAPVALGILSMGRLYRWLTTPDERP